MQDKDRLKSPCCWEPLSASLPVPLPSTLKASTPFEYDNILDISRSPRHHAGEAQPDTD